MAGQFFNVVNGECRSSTNTERGVDPRTEEELWEAPVASIQDLDDAVAAAKEAFKTWSISTVEERKAVMVKMAERVKDNAEELQELTTKETGKSRFLASLEVEKARVMILYYVENPLSDEVAHEDDSVKIVNTHTPLGVVGAISAWNFPFFIACLKTASALITGNCVVVKPSPFTPYATLRLVELWRDLAPPGVVQAVNGGPEVGAAMTLHPGIAKISFTGSIATGRKVMANCGKTMKNVTLELGGNDAAIVCEDVDVPKVAEQVAIGSFLNGGQVCVATKRVYVHESIYDAFLEAYLKVVEAQFEAGSDVGATTVFGPLSNRQQFDIVKEFVEDSKKNNHKIVTGGKVGDKGFWVEPTVVAKPPEDSRLVKEEQFGPIVPILSYSDTEDVLQRANLDNAGLGATVYTKDMERGERLARRLEAGSVWINMPETQHPAGYVSGIKDSGAGGEMGKLGLLGLVYTKSLHFSKS